MKVKELRNNEEVQAGMKTETAVKVSVTITLDGVDEIRQMERILDYAERGMPTVIESSVADMHSTLTKTVSNAFDKALKNKGECKMAKVFKGFNLNLGTKKEVKMLREIMQECIDNSSEDLADLAQEIIEAIDDKIVFDNDLNGND